VVGNTRAAIVLPDKAPIASIVLIPGGTTRQTIGADGAGSTVKRPVFLVSTSNGTAVATANAATLGGAQ
jgi:hypothetical protein